MLPRFSLEAVVLLLHYLILRSKLGYLVSAGHFPRKLQIFQCIQLFGLHLELTDELLVVNVDALKRLLQLPLALLQIKNLTILFSNTCLQPFYLFVSCLQLFV